MHIHICIYIYIERDECCMCVYIKKTLINMINSFLLYVHILVSLYINIYIWRERDTYNLIWIYLYVYI